MHKFASKIYFDQNKSVKKYLHINDVVYVYNFRDNGVVKRCIFKLDILRAVCEKIRNENTL